MIENSTLPDAAICPRVEVAGSLPNLVEAALFTSLSTEISSSLRPEDLTRVCQTIRSRGLLDYENDWAGFSYLYFGANYVKALLALRAVDLPSVNGKIKILDLGCGAGASTVGAIAGMLPLLASRGILVEKITGVDISQRQLAVFNNVARPWIESVQPQARIETHCANIFDYVGEAECDADLVILSYVTAELTGTEKDRLLHMLRKRLAGGHRELVIIESNATTRGISIELLNKSFFTIPYSEIKLDFPLLHALHLASPPKFSEERHHFLKLIDQYFDAWKRHDIGLLRKIFCADARYHICGSKVLQGIDQIVHYWTHNSHTQRDVRCRAETIHMLENGVSMTWSAEFDRIDCAEHVKLEGMMWLLVQNGVIQELSEAYVQRREPMALRRSE